MADEIEVTPEMERAGMDVLVPMLTAVARMGVSRGPGASFAFDSAAIYRAMERVRREQDMCRSIAEMNALFPMLPPLPLPFDYRDPGDETPRQGAK